MLGILRRAFSFTSWTTAHPNEPPPGDMLDASFDAQDQKISEIEALVADVRRSDGGLQNGVVGIDQLHPDLKAALRIPTTQSSNGDELGWKTAEATADVWAHASADWAEHMPDTIPDGSVAVMDVTGDHWSSRWWANYAARIVSDHAVAPPIIESPATVADAMVTSFGAAVLAVHTQSYAASPIQGGALYERTSLATITAAGYPSPSYFRSVDRFMPGGGTDATNGGYWLLAEDAPSPQMFGAIGDGVTDDTAAIQAAIDSISAGGSTAGGRLFFPKGVYLLSAALSNAASGVFIEGESRWNVVLVQSNLTANIIDNSGSFFRLENIRLRYNGTPLPAATAITNTGNYSHFSDFIIGSAYHGMHIDSCSSVKLTRFEILDFGSTGLWLSNCSDIFYSQFTINAGSDAKGTTGCIVYQNKVEAAVGVSGDVILGVHPLYMLATTNAPAGRPAYNSFYGVFFDSGAQDAFLDKTVETDFTGCWFSGGRIDTGYPGMTIQNSDSVRFIGCRFFNCGSHGAVVQPNAVRTTFTDCAFDSNSRTRGSGLAHGLVIASNASDFSVLNCTAGNNNWDPGNQGYGIIVNAGTSTRYSIIGCNVTNNITGGIALPALAAGTVRYVHSNPGQSDAWTAFTPVVTASTGTITSVTSVSGRYQKIGNRFDIQMQFTITTNGTGAGIVHATIPFTMTHDAIGVGHASPGSGTMLKARLQAALGYLQITRYDGTYPGADGIAMTVSVTCEA